MTIEKKLLGTNPVATGDGPEAVSFDGTSDYLSRSSDLTGNSDSKTFTFSCWVYRSQSTTIIYRNTQSGDSGMEFNANAGNFNFNLRSNANVSVVVGNLPNAFPLNTFSHLIMSVDSSNASSRWVFINDTDMSASVSWSAYANTAIDFTKSSHEIAAYNGGVNLKGRLAHLFLDYTYRDLSTTANRRLFITADGKPSDTIPSSPILYLPMKDAATAGVNSGTGGNFTVNGVLATAERGPNQDNCVASTFDGSNDYLSRSSITNIADGKKVTFSCTISETDSGSTANIFGGFNAATGGSPTVRMVDGALQFTCDARVSATATSPLPFAEGSHHSIQISFDLADTSKRHMFINGVEATVTWHSYTNANMPFTDSTLWQVMNEVGATDRTKGKVGEFYFNTAYIDLSADNPFWDSKANRPNSVRKVIADTSVTPLIALPMLGNDAGNNLGSGGDFTVNSGPYTGARGGSEFWSRSAYFASTSTYMRLTAPLSNSKTLTLACSIQKPASGDGGVLDVFTAGDGDSKIRLLHNPNNGSFNILGRNSSDTIIFNAAVTGGVSSNSWNTLLISFDLTNSAKRNATINGAGSVAWETFTNDTVNLARDLTIGLGDTNATAAAGNIGFVYMTTDYVDLTQEVNRHKFIDQLGYPRDLTQQIEDGDIPNPTIYMKFDDTAALGTNSGSGGNFTVNGTVTAGADFIL